MCPSAPEGRNAVSSHSTRLKGIKGNNSLHETLLQDYLISLMKAEPEFNNCTKATCPWNFNMDFWEEKISQPFTRRSLKEKVLSSLSFKTNIANILTPCHGIAIYGGWSWLPTWLYLKSTEIQPTGHNCEGCFLSSFEVERPVLNLDQLRLENPSQIWVTPSGGSPHKKSWKKACAPLPG